MELWDGYNENEEKIGIDIVRGSKIKNDNANNRKIKKTNK